MLLTGYLGIKCHSQYNSIRLLQHSSANKGDRGCNVHDLQTIIVLVLLAFNFIPQRSHHSLTLPRSRIRHSATVTLTPEDGRTAIKVALSAYPISLFSRMEKCSEVIMRNNNWPKTLQCGSLDTTLTSLLRQPSTITCCDQFDRNLVNLPPWWCNYRHGGVSGSALACGACKSCWRPGFESRVKRASQFKKSQTAVSSSERQITLSVICLIVECTKDSVRVTKKNILIVVGRLGWKWIERSVLQLLLLKQKEVELL